MRPGQAELLDSGGLNPTMYNAETEGGPRNGVMTALDDFMAEYDRPLRLVYLPIYFGLAIVVDAGAAATNSRSWPPRSTASRAATGCAELLERRRGRAPAGDDLPAQRLLPAPGADASGRTQRYLDVVKGALLDEHYLEHEARLAYLLRMPPGRHAPARARIAPRPGAPRPELQAQLRPAAPRRSAVPTTAAESSFLPYTAMGRHASRRARAVPRHRSAPKRSPATSPSAAPAAAAARIFMRAYLDALRDAASGACGSPIGSGRHPNPTGRRGCRDEGVAGFQADLQPRARRLPTLRPARRHGALPARPARRHARRTRRSNSSRCCASGRARRARCAPCSTVSTTSSPPGGFVDRRRLRATRRASKERRGVPRRPRDQRAARAHRRVDDRLAEGSRPRGRAASNAAAVAGCGTPPLAPTAPKDALDLTVVVVMYNMRREATRTLHALSRAYQEGHRRHHLRGARRRERLRRRREARRRVRRELRTRVPLRRPRRGRAAVAGASR